MPYTAKIAVSAATYAIDRPYDYLVPDALRGTLRPGMRVAVPFGVGNRSCDGIVLSLSDAPVGEKKLKSILAQLDQEPMLDEKAIRLALWMREQYFCTVYDAARAMLPAGLWFSLKDCWRVAPGTDREAVFEAAGQSKTAVRLAELLFANQGWAELAQIRVAFGTTDPNPAIRKLEEAGVIVKETSTARGVGDKTEKVASLLMPPEEAMALVSARRRKAPLQYAVVEALCAVGQVSAKELCYFTGASPATLKALEKAGVLELTAREVYRRPAIPDVVETLPPPILNEEQNAAFQGLLKLCEGEKAEAALLYGVTGSGKTQVYIKLIHTLLERGKQALVLVPEIALTPQLMEKFAVHFGSDVAIMHSALSAGERYDEWKRIRSGKASVVVGTRSAVFAPLTRLGLIILDEEQEPSYKSEQAPRYHARDVARYRCAKSNALLVLGSATPAVETMYRAREGDYHLFRLSQRYNAKEMPAVKIADMKQELRRGNGGSISKELEEELRVTISRGEQAILFLNRRGASRRVTCGECGESPTCPRCSVYLTYHSANGRLMCHYCGHSEPLPKYCPDCGGLLNFVGTGTQKAEEELRQLFPDTEILRMDTDTVTATKSHEAILEQFRKKQIPILLGTQMVAKGLDFENVTLVGALAADQSLYAEDYHGGERTFSLLTQVVGRSGRGEKEGRAVIQTYMPDHEIIQCAARQDYDAFYDQEIRLRKLRNHPPFSDLIVISVSGLEETAVLQVCAKLRHNLENGLAQPPYNEHEYVLLGPAPATIARVNNRYRYRMTLNTKNVKAVRQLLAHFDRMAQSDKNHRGVSVFVDINPLD